MEENEVIAVKAKSYLVEGIIVVLFLPFLCWYLFYEYRDALTDSGVLSQIMRILCIVLIVICVVVACYTIINYVRAPYNVLVRQGDELIFMNVRFKITDIADVNYHRMHARGFYYKTGRLIVKLNNGTTIKCNCVKEVEQAHSRLFAIIRESDKKEEA